MKSKVMGLAKVDEQWEHKPTLTEMEAWTVDAIATYNQRPGHPPIPASFLAEYTGMTGRDVRTMVNHLIDRCFHGLPIYPLPGAGGGYFMGDLATTERARAAATTHLKRVITGGRKARDMGASVEELSQSMVQMTLGLDGADASKVGQEVSAMLAEAGLPVSHDAVSAALARYQGDPERYAQEIRDLAEQFGGMFIRQADLRRVLQTKTQELVDAAMRELGAGEAGA